MINLKIIAAMDQNGVIGYRGKMPWNIPADLKMFRNKTLNKCIIMGRKIAQKDLVNPLPKRTNIVLSKDPCMVLKPGFYIADSPNDALFMANYLDERIEQDVFVIGGSGIYTSFINLAQTLLLTEIHETFPGDVHFPKYDKSKFKEVSRIKNNQGDLKFDFVTYEKI